MVHGATYILYPASEGASICSHFSSAFPGGFDPITCAGVDYYVIDNGTKCDVATEHASMRAACDSHIYSAEIIDILKYVPARKRALVVAGGVAKAAATGDEESQEYRDSYKAAFDAFDLDAQIELEKPLLTVDPANITSEQARHFSQAQSEVSIP